VRRQAGPTGEGKEPVCQRRELLCKMPALLPTTSVGLEDRGQSLSSSGLDLKKDLGIRSETQKEFRCLSPKLRS